MTARRPLLQPLVPLYRAALCLRGLQHKRPGSQRALASPVVSVGSVSAGGAGKTPFLAALARLLLQDGDAPVILSRGYGRKSRGALRVDPDGTAVQYGDEPLMLARHLRVPVYVGESRYAAGRLAEADGPAHRRVFLLDDGFSHRALARTLDIALLTLEDTRDHLLPAGNLREPLAALARADVLVLRAGEAKALRAFLRGQKGLSMGAEKPVWTVRRKLLLPPEMPAHPIVFSGIARPADFAAMLRQRGVEAAGERRFSDHHTPTMPELDALRRFGRASHADGFVTTAKDAVKLTPPMLEVLHAVGPVAVADAVVEFDEPEQVRHDLRTALSAKADRHR